MLPSFLNDIPRRRRLPRRRSPLEDQLETAHLMIEATTSGSGDKGPNFETATPHHRVRNIHPRSASREIFNVTKAEREANIEPHGVPNDRRQKLVAVEMLVVRHLIRQVEPC